MEIFRRQNYNQIWITLKSDEILGVLDSSYLQDYNGTQGQLSLYNLETQQRFPILMSEVTGFEDPTPNIPHDVFTGYIELNFLPNGNYKLQGLVRDIVGNYTILSEISNPTGLERIIQFDLRITEDEIILLFPQVSIKLGMLFTVSLPSINIDFLTPIRKTLNNSSKIQTVRIFPMTIVKYLTLKGVVHKNGVLSSPIRQSMQLIANIEGFNI